jgi:hypothetical protein
MNTQMSFVSEEHSADLEYHSKFKNKNKNDAIKT